MAKKDNKDYSPLDQKALLANIRKTFGPEIAFRLGEPGVVPDVTMLPTSIATLDEAIGGGIPQGKIIEIFGPEASGKTAVATAIVGSLQKQGFPALYIDMEYALNLAYAASNGMDIDNVTVSQPETAEIAMQVMETVVRRSADPMVVVLDSVASLVTEEEINADPGSALVGKTARLMNQMMRKLVGPTSTGNHVVIFTNQIRYKIGVMYGNPETTPGGQGLKFASSVRINTRNRGMIGKIPNTTGIMCEARIDKNKVGPPFSVAKFDIMYKGGIDKVGATVKVASNKEVLRKGGNYWYLPGEEKYFATSEATAVQFMKDNPDVYQDVYNQVAEALKPPVIEVLE
jgi:recombination protein RecA